MSESTDQRITINQPAHPNPEKLAKDVETMLPGMYAQAFDRAAELTLDKAATVFSIAAEHLAMGDPEKAQSGYNTGMVLVGEASKFAAQSLHFDELVKMPAADPIPDDEPSIPMNGAHQEPPAGEHIAPAIEAPAEVPADLATDPAHLD